ncbi:MAG: hypothetical protein Q9172_007834 [Xanthocarpia lactea]
MKFTAATSFTLLLPLALAGSLGSANVNHDAVKVRSYHPDVAADKPTNTSAALGYPDVPQDAEGNNTGMQHSDTGVDSMDNKNLVVGERRYERDGHRRVEFKLEYGQTWFQQTWEVRDGVLKQVPEESSSSSNDTSTQSYSGSDDMMLDTPVPPGGNMTEFGSDKLGPEEPSGSNTTLGGPTTMLNSTLDNNDTMAGDYPNLPANDTSNADTTKLTVGNETDGGSEPTTMLNSTLDNNDTMAGDYPNLPANDTSNANTTNPTVGDGTDGGSNTTASDMMPNGANQTDTLVGGPMGGSDETARTGLTPPPSEDGAAELDAARPGYTGRRLRS